MLHVEDWGVVRSSERIRRNTTTGLQRMGLGKAAAARFPFKGAIAESEVQEPGMLIPGYSGGTALQSLRASTPQRHNTVTLMHQSFAAGLDDERCGLSREPLVHRNPALLSRRPLLNLRGLLKSCGLRTLACL